MAPLGIGTQTAGSVIRPASFCGVYGYKATFGTLSFAGVRHYAESFDTLGCMARSVEDLAFFRDVLLGSSPLPSSRSRAGRVSGSAAPTTGTRRTRRPGPVSRTERGGSPQPAWPWRTWTSPRGFEEALEVYNRIQLFEGARCFAPDADAHPDLLSVDARTLHERGHGGGDGELPGGAPALPRVARRGRRGVLGLRRGAHPERRRGEAPEGLRFTGNIVFNYLWTALHLPAVTIPRSRGRGACRSGRSSSLPGMPTTGCSPSRRWPPGASSDAAGALRPSPGERPLGARASCPRGLGARSGGNPAGVLTALPGHDSTGPRLHPGSIP